MYSKERKLDTTSRKNLANKKNHERQKTKQAILGRPHKLKKNIPLYFDFKVTLNLTCLVNVKLHFNLIIRLYWQQEMANR